MALWGYRRATLRERRPSGSSRMIFPDLSGTQNLSCCCLMGWPDLGREEVMMVSRRNMPMDSKVMKAAKRSKSVHTDPVKTHLRRVGGQNPTWGRGQSWPSPKLGVFAEAAHSKGCPNHYESQCDLDHYGRSGNYYSCLRSNKGCRAWRGRSGANFDGSADGDQGPDLVDLLVSDGDAAESPVVEAVSGADQALAVGQAVDHDVAARGDTEAGSALAVVGIGVRDVERLV